MKLGFLTAITLCVFSIIANAQNPLVVPSTLSGTSFNLNVQSGTQVFYNGTLTPTYGINGPLLGPTLIVNKGDSITLNVINTLPVKTTMHWHGLHVDPENDGGPHQIINPNSTWSPSFTIRNNAGTFWYHPHGAGQTDPQVSKGLAGLILVKDAIEAGLSIPRNYGIDDFPLIVQTKDFDILKQIAIATNTDTALFVNGTLDPYLNVPEQVVRFRLLNGSSMRSYNFGFSNNQLFYQIATDGGMLDTSVPLTRLRLSPGERAEILVNFSTMIGQTVFLKSYASELPTGIYGADSVGFGNDTIHEYQDNFLNGADFNILKLNVVTSTPNAIVTIPNALIPYSPFTPANATNFRRIEMDTLRLLPGSTPNRAEGPFGLNNKSFHMDSINEVVYLNTTEIWTIVNKTLVAHPFHMHDIQFNILEKNGQAPIPSEKGWKDVVLVMPGDSVKFITKFETFTNPTVPYMYHCHLLHHEDDGMMGSFIVIDSAWAAGAPMIEKINEFEVYPNPTKDYIYIFNKTNKTEIENIYLSDLSGRKLQEFNFTINTMDVSNLVAGLYYLTVATKNNKAVFKIIRK